MNLENKKNEVNDNSSNLNIFLILNEIKNFKIIISVITLIGLFLSLYLYFSQVNNYQLKLQIYNNPEADFNRDSTERNEAMTNLVFNFTEQLVFELNSETTQKYLDNNTRLNFIEKSTMPLNVKFTSPDLNKLEEIGAELIDTININVNSRLKKLINDKINFVNDYIELIDSQVNQTDTNQYDNLQNQFIMNSIIMKNINLGETKLQLLVTFKEYQLLLERANASEYTNFQVINMSNNQYDLRSTKRGLVPIVTIGTLLGIFLGVLLSIILVIREKSI